MLIEVVCLILVWLWWKEYWIFVTWLYLMTKNRKIVSERPKNQFFCSWNKTFSERWWFLCGFSMSAEGKRPLRSKERGVFFTGWWLGSRGGGGLDGVSPPGLVPPCRGWRGCGWCGAGPAAPHLEHLQVAREKLRNLKPTNQKPPS